MVALALELIKNKAGKNNQKCLEPFNQEALKKVLNLHKSMWGYYHGTPLIELKALADWFGVKGIVVKDESKRFGLNAFKALGASYAISCYLAKLLDRKIEDLTFDYLMSEEVKGLVGKLVFATATDGNHGRGVAWVARLLGFEAVIYMPKGSSAERVKNIEREGARVRVTNFNYDDTVRMLAKDAKNNGWIIVQDSAWEGYEEIPLWIMQGYTTMVAEALDSLPEAPTHVFAQAGVGSMAAAVQAVITNKHYAHEPVFTILEASAANCFYRSFEQDKPVSVGGELNTMMAGLACGESNFLAWDILHSYSDFCLSCKDEVAALGMRLLANPLGDDPKIIAGESGAIGAGVIGLLEKFHNLKSELGLNKNSILLLFNTEGATDSDNYYDIVWGGLKPIDYRRKF